MRPALGGEIAADDLEQGRFAGAVGADQPHRPRLRARANETSRSATTPPKLRETPLTSSASAALHREPPATAFLNTSPTIPFGARRMTTEQHQPVDQDVEALDADLGRAPVGDLGEEHHDGAADDRAERGAEPAEQRGQLQLDRLREAERRLRIDRHVELHVEHGGERGHRRAEHEAEKLGAEHSDAGRGRRHLVVAHRLHLEPEARLARIQRVIQ